MVCCIIVVVVCILNGKDMFLVVSVSELSVVDFINVLWLMFVCCFFLGIIYFIVVIILLYIDNYNEIINMLMM